MVTEHKSIDFPYKKAMVTGGAGFIGSHIVEELVTMGVETISIDNYSAGKKENLAHLTSYANLREERCDVLDYELLNKHMEGVDVIFHEAASKKTVCLRDPRIDLDVNAKGTYNMLELAVKHGVKKFVHASTGSVYGEPRYFPQNEEHPLNPSSYYGVSKLAGEKYVRAFTDLYGLDATILRYFHVYGPRQESSDVGGVVAIFARGLLENKVIKIHGDGEQQRSFTYVKDVVRANIRASITPGVKGDAFNCASGLKITITELYKDICDIIGRHPSVVHDDDLIGDIKKFDIDNSKILKRLGMVFDVGYKEGLDKTVSWCESIYGSRVENE